ncbi:MAG: hypothetical protein KF681_09555 [Bdellovibrionaceae bacterium]|nr:hypothetical protein [Pseudobdellovibrionaceae bacterium]
MLQSVLVLILSVVVSTQTMASGCDDSCWGASTPQVLAQSRWGLRDFFSIEPSGDPSSIQLTPKSAFVTGAFPSPVIFTDYERSRPLHPKLVARLLDPNTRFNGTVTKADVRIEITPNYGAPYSVVTGQYQIEFYFETGETVTLYHPSVATLIRSEDGTVIEDQILPRFFPDRGPRP